ncbi:MULTISPECIES: DUF6542 domain-containing protein [unclassified Pseudonocardia]|uniref:DUF6542 domain-containing protein n=1 Tax=unclassified Pseudonocardia TaxID=2619320 RepID=UPI0007615BC7|nr:MULTISPECIES: DUF6542 domain-containing protein [unclassified Pseudonocardia]
MTTRTSSARRPGGSASRSPAPARGSWPVRERSLLRPVLGIPPLAAIGIAVATTAVGVLVDLLRIGTVGRVFEVGYLLGCVLAVSWVRRRSIFLPAVQPPLLLAVVVPLTAVLIGAPTGGGAAESVLMAGAPLINAFPAMAVTTAVVLLVTGFRLLRQRLGPDDSVGRLRARLGRDPGGHDPDGPGGTPGAGRSRRGGARNADTERPGERRPGRGRSGRGTTTGRSADGRGRPGGAGGATERSPRRGSTGRAGDGAARTGSTGRADAGRGGSVSDRSGSGRSGAPGSGGSAGAGGVAGSRSSGTGRSGSGRSGIPGAARSGGTGEAGGRSTSRSEGARPSGATRRNPSGRTRRDSG